ncbi:MAG: aspartate dehydrogenase [Pseudomonadota bacterium]
MTSPLNIVLVGHGAIAGYVAEQILPVSAIDIVALVCRESSYSKASQFADDRFPVFTSVELIEPKPDLLVDCAGHSGLLSHAPLALRSGVDVISISTGALAEPGIAEELEECAKAGGSSIRFLSGAIGGIDALTSASSGDIDSVVYTGRKPPQGWEGSPAESLCNLVHLTEPFEHYSGSARDAAKLYPKNANVAATIALASIGLDNVDVKLIADPSVDKNIHEIEATGSFGCLTVRMEGNPLPGNPKSSALAAMSVVGELKRRINRVGI